MNDEEREALWQEILAARVDFPDQPAPLRPAGRNGTRRRESRKSAQFNEALSGLGSWSTIDAPQRRMSA